MNVNQQISTGNDKTNHNTKNQLEIADNEGDSSMDPILNEYGGFSTDYTAEFDVLEKARSIIRGRDLIAEEGQQYNLTVPKNWTTEALNLNIETFHKDQTITDPTLSDTNYWWDDDRASGNGEINNYWYPEENNPEYVNTELLFNQLVGGSLGYAKGDFGRWETEMTNLNPYSLNISQGQKYQEEDETIYSEGFETDPRYFEDLENPYGGVRRTGDSVDLKYESDGFLELLINPSTSQFSGNPSAAFWDTLVIPFESDYAQMTIEWQLDEDSNFDPADDYRICARINDRYIDGNNDYLYGDVQAHGSETSLFLYNQASVITNEKISMTFNITSQIDGLRGVNKFDFGAWAKNPTTGDEDKIRLRFHSIEILYNTSDKYEIAKLEFDYKALDNSGLFDLITPSASEYPLSLMSVYMYLEDLEEGDIFAKKRVIPFHYINIRDSNTEDPFDHFTYNISQKFIEDLNKTEIGFKLGIEFEYDYSNSINLDVYFDNITFTINYKHSDPEFSELQLRIDEKGLWKNISESSYDVSVEDWEPGTNHTFQFRTENSTFQDLLFMNLRSNMTLNFTDSPTGEAFAKYQIGASNDDTGYWNITYNNTYAYERLEQAQN